MQNNKKSMLRKSFHFIINGEAERERLLEDFCRLVKKIPKQKNLLDVGCARGDSTLLYANILSVPSGNIHGVEYKDDLIEECSSKVKTAALNIEEDHFPYPDQKFSIVFCNQVLEHVKNMFYPLSEMERVLEVGGYLALGIPNLAALHNRIRLLIGLQPVSNAIIGAHVRCFTHKSFMDFIKLNHNFRFISTTGSSLYPLPYPFVKYGARIFPGLSAYTFYILQKIKHNMNESLWLEHHLKASNWLIEKEGN